MTDSPLAPSPLPVPRLLREWGEASPSELTDAVRARREAGLPVADLVTANPHEHGYVFPPEVIERALVDGLRVSHPYRPDARGNVRTREAVASWHGARSADDVVLTPGSSFAYWACFRLLCEPGDEVLCPVPTYPLFDDLARLAGASVRSYHLRRDSTGRWGIDVEEVAFQITPRTRVLVVVSPHNPTGTVASVQELTALGELARRHGLAIVFDEVFREVRHAATCVPRPSDCGAPLCVTLNGLSKMLSLPGLKAGWMVVEGDAEQRRRLLAAMEYLCDTFLPVNEAVQAAVPELLKAGAGPAAEFAAQYRAAMERGVAAWRAEGFNVAMPDGGVYLPVPVPVRDAPAAALDLVRAEGVLVHPGELYRFPVPHVVTTVVNADVEAIARAAARLRRGAA
jgi:aspartate/methionine/tyrosine aminotransferase